MKRFTNLLIISAVSFGVSSAATYQFLNGSGATASGITDKDGLAFRSGTTVGQSFTGVDLNSNWTSAGPGVVAIGVFSTDTLSTLTQTQLISAFTNQFMVSTFSAGPGGQRGTFSFNSNQTTITNSAFSNQFMYMFAGNGSTIANSTQFLVLKSNTKFQATDDAIPTVIPVSFLPSNTTLLFGTTVANVPTTNTDSSTNPGWAMAAPVPETSTTLLGALGALAMLRRRRR